MPGEKTRQLRKISCISSFIKTKVFFADFMKMIIFNHIKWINEDF